MSGECPTSSTKIEAERTKASALIKQSNEERRSLEQEAAEAMNSIGETGKLKRRHGLFVLWIPGLFTSIWLWLYAGAGFILKRARRFDVGFQWFRSKFDIEKRPLSAICLVSGALVAICYWAGAIVMAAILRG